MKEAVALVFFLVCHITASPVRVHVAVDHIGQPDTHMNNDDAEMTVAAAQQDGGEGEGEGNEKECIDLKMAGGYSGTVCGANTTVPHSDKCLLMLPGKGNNFNSFKLFQTTAADLGYSAFSLQYQASPDTFSSCHKTYDDLDCGEKMRQTKQEGGEHGAKIKVKVEQSVDYRTLDMLKFLAGKAEKQPPASLGDPAQWNSCMTGAGDKLAVNWAKIAVAGGSEGSGQAAWTGHAHAVDRVVMFSGIDDAIEYNLIQGNYSSPPWLSDAKGKTPKSKYFGFGEVSGTACRAWHLNFNTIAMGPDAWTNVNLVDPTYGYGNAHRLCSDRSTSGGLGHVATVWDSHTPKNKDGTPAYRPTWIHMLTSTSISDAVGSDGSADVDYINSNEVGSGADAGFRSPAPALPDKTEVRLSPCESYKSLTQRWAYVAADKQLQLIDAHNPMPEGPPLVLTCQAKSCAAKSSAMVASPAKEASPPQQWELKGGQISSTVSGLCIGQDPNPEVEAGLLTLQDCTNPTAYKFQLASQLLKVTVGGDTACLSAKYANVTKCQCRF